MAIVPRSNRATRTLRSSPSSRPLLFKAAAAVGTCVILLMNVLFITRQREKAEGRLASIPFEFASSSLSLSSSLNNPSEESVTNLAYRQSFGFFNNIGDKDWKLLQTITAEHENHRYPDEPLTNNPNFDKREWKVVNSFPAWWQNNYEPNFSCQLERRIGGPNGNGDGPKWICDPHQIQRLARERKSKDPSHPGCVVYSVGCSGDFSFELGMQQQLGKGVCEYHIFDVDNYAVMAQQVGLERVFFHHWGLGSQNDKSSRQKLKSGQMLKGLHDTVRELGHENLEAIDIFKIDCEGCEWTTFQDWVSPNMPRLQQIQVELHKAPLEVIDFFDTLEYAGYVRTHKEPNIQFGASCVEYAFLKLDREFFSARKQRKSSATKGVNRR